MPESAHDKQLPSNRHVRARSPGGTRRADRGQKVPHRPSRQAKVPAWPAVVTPQVVCCPCPGCDPRVPKGDRSGDLRLPVFYTARPASSGTPLSEWPLRPRSTGFAALRMPSYG